MLWHVPLSKQYRAIVRFGIYSDKKFGQNNLHNIDFLRQ